MPIRKQDFYEGAALRLVACAGQVGRIRWQAPFFLLNDRLSVLLKYSTRGRSPWGFTFTVEEQKALKNVSGKYSAVIGLICGADGVVALPYEDFQFIGPDRLSAIHVGCHRGHGEFYHVSGPDRALNKKIPPANWQRILDL